VGREVGEAATGLEDQIGASGVEVRRIVGLPRGPISTGKLANDVDARGIEAVVAAGLVCVGAKNPHQTDPDLVAELRVVSECVQRCQAGGSHYGGLEHFSTDHLTPHLLVASRQRKK